MWNKILLLILFFSSINLSAEEVTSETPQQQLQAFLDNTHSMSARFQQKLVDQYGMLIQQSAGQLSLLRPGKFRWDYILPYPQNIISNGAKIWMYDSELEQVNVRPYEQVLASSPVKLLDNAIKLEQEYRMEPLRARDGQQWLQLTPRQADSDFKGITIGLLKGQIKTMSFMDSFNQVTEITFEQLVINPGFSKQWFEFIPPADADVVGDF